MKKLIETTWHDLYVLYERKGNKEFSKLLTWMVQVLDRAKSDMHERAMVLLNG